MRKRLPEFQSILQVYAVIAVMFSGWTITAFLWKLSAWMLLLNLGELFTIFSYAMAANFIESLVVLGVLLLACIVLPPHLLRDDFVPRGTILSLGLIGSLMAFVGIHMLLGIESGFWLWVPPLMVLGLMILVLHAGLMRSAAIWLSDRVTVFLLVLLPLFAILSVYVLYRTAI